MVRRVALLRGINVGGKNVIKMAALKACFEKLGFERVVTYIQSGNVVFDAAAPDPQKRIEAALSKAFRYDASVVLRTQAEMKQIVKGAPEGFGSAPDEFRYDVMFLKATFNVAAALEQVVGKPGVDTVHGGKGALYFSRLIEKAAQSQLAKLTGKPIYQQMTIRNWNTTTALLQLMETDA